MLIGAVLRDAAPRRHRAPRRDRPRGRPPRRRGFSERFVEILVAIHALDVDAVGLGDFAKREGYLARQVARWSDQWERSKIEDTPVIDDLGRLLDERMPQHGTTLVGDYRLGNVMLDRTDAAVVLAVLDWEMATLGDPLSDLAYTLLYWSTTHRPLDTSEPSHRRSRASRLPATSWRATNT